jgi:hypothetical protein
MRKSFNIQEFLHCKSKHHGTKLMHPSSSRAFQRDQERNLKHPNSMDLISINKTKQNKQTTFINGVKCFVKFLKHLLTFAFDLGVNEKER